MKLIKPGQFSLLLNDKLNSFHSNRKKFNVYYEGGTKTSVIFRLVHGFYTFSVFCFIICGYLLLHGFYHYFVYAYVYIIFVLLIFFCTCFCIGYLFFYMLDFFKKKNVRSFFAAIFVIPDSFYDYVPAIYQSHIKRANLDNTAIYPFRRLDSRTRDYMRSKYYPFYNHPRQVKLKNYYRSSITDTPLLMHPQFSHSQFDLYRLRPLPVSAYLGLDSNADLNYILQTQFVYTTPYPQQKLSFQTLTVDKKYKLIEILRMSILLQINFYKISALLLMRLCNLQIISCLLLF